jgi:lipopolysaccharide transport system permease protein
MFSYSVALWVAPLNAVYRDVGIALPFAMQLLMYLSPVVYPATLVPEKYRWLYQLNPIAVLVNTMRWVVLGGEPPSIGSVAMFAVFTAVLFVGGSRLFRAMEGTLVDRI